MVLVAQFQRRWRRLIVHSILHADDSPHAIAMGVGTATFIAFLPLVGLQTVIAVAIAAAIRANKAVCIPIVWITNPITMVPIYGSCLMVGGLVTGKGSTESQQATLKSLTEYEGAGRFLEMEFWRDLLNVFLSFGVDLWVGCILVGTVFGVLGYFLSRWGLSTYRERRRRRKLKRDLFRARRRTTGIVRPHGN